MSIVKIFLLASVCAGIISCTQASVIGEWQQANAVTADPLVLVINPDSVFRLGSASRVRDTSSTTGSIIGKWSMTDRRHLSLVPFNKPAAVDYEILKLTATELVIVPAVEVISDGTKPLFFSRAN